MTAFSPWPWRQRGKLHVRDDEVPDTDRMTWADTEGCECCGSFDHHRVQCPALMSFDGHPLSSDEIRERRERR